MWRGSVPGAPARACSLAACPIPRPRLSAVNEIDMSALESLEEINRRLKEMDIALHLSEVKGPVMDRLRSSHFLETLNGHVFLAQFDAFRTLSSDSTERAA